MGWVLLCLSTFVQIVEAKSDGDPSWVESKLAVMQRWNQASVEFDETRSLVDVVCGKEVRDAFRELGALANKISAGIAKSDLEIYKKSNADFFKQILNVQSAVRKELGADDVG